MSSEVFTQERVGVSLAVSSLAGVGLFAAGAIANDSLDFWYLPYNLALALLPLLFALWLRRLLQKQAWLSWRPLLLTLVWILFLPNSFYIISDFIHLREMPRVDVLLDVVMLASFTFTGLAFGFIGLYVVHRELIKRVSFVWAATLIGVLLLLCSFAIYIGRDLRWNSWDIVLHPFALTLDIFERIFNPFAHPQAFATTAMFFVLLTSIYGVLWQTAKLIPQSLPKNK